jgi:hypothetical protein
MIIAAFDVATSTGVCVGELGGKPSFLTWNLRAGGASRPMRLLYFMRSLRDFFDVWPEASVVYEAPQTMATMNRIGTADSTIAFLRGAIGVLEATCAERGRPVEAIPVQDARGSILGWRTNPRPKGKKKSDTKARVFREVQYHGVYPKTEDEADAAVLWLYACARLNPRIALQMTPLFR